MGNRKSLQCGNLDNYGWLHWFCTSMAASKLDNDRQSENEENQKLQLLSLKLFPTTFREMETLVIIVLTDDHPWVLWIV